jgi:hypothetical protein
MLVRHIHETRKRAGSNKETDDEGDGVRESHSGQRKSAPPTAEAFAAMDRFTEELTETLNGIFTADANIGTLNDSASVPARSVRALRKDRFQTLHDAFNFLLCRRATQAETDRAHPDRRRYSHRLQHRREFNGAGVTRGTR